MLVRGSLVNEFGEKVGRYNINGNNEYFVSLYGESKGYITEKQLNGFAMNMGLSFEEQKTKLGGQKQ